MANPQKGEVSIRVEGRVYTLALTLNAMVAVEALFSTPEKPVTFEEVRRLSNRGSAQHFQGLVWSTFQLHHPEVTLDDVGLIAHRAGGIYAFWEHIRALWESLTPDEQDLRALGVKPSANPPGAQASRPHGTGMRSKPMRVGSA